MGRKQYPRSKKRGRKRGRKRFQERSLASLDKQDERHTFFYEKDNYNYRHERKPKGP